MLALMYLKRTNGVFAALAAFSLAASSQTAQANDNEAIVLAPLSPWNLDMGANSCRIARHVGSEDKPTIFYMEQWGPSDQATWMVAGGPFSKFRRFRQTQFAFGPDGDSGEFESAKWTFGEYGDALRYSSSIAMRDPAQQGQEADNLLLPRKNGLPRLDSGGADGITRLMIIQKGQTEVQVELGNLKAPLEALNGCIANLVEHWGFNLEEQRTIVTPPRLSNFDEVAQKVIETFKDGVIPVGARADFILRLTVSKTGTMTSCELLNQTLADSFQIRRHPCRILERFANFEPALNAAGEPVESFHTVTIVH